MNEPVSETTRLLAQQLRPEASAATKKLREANWKAEQEDERWKERRFKALMKTGRYTHAGAEKQVAEEFRKIQDDRFAATQERRQRAQDEAEQRWRHENSPAMKILRFSEELREKDELDANDRHSWQYLVRSVHSGYRIKVPPLNEVLEAEDNPIEKLFDFG